MVIQAQIHLFGSREGYRTLRTSDSISREDKSHLEVLGFGQTDQAEYLDSLRDSPALLGRPLPSGSYAVTRCYPGLPDSANRQTLLFISLVVRPDDWLRLALNLLWLSQQHAIWESAVSTKIQNIDLQIPAESDRAEVRPQTFGLIDALLTNQNTRTLIAVDSTAATDADVLLVPSLLPARERLRLAWGTRLLSQSLNLDICSFAMGTSAKGARRVIGPHTTLVKPYTETLQHMCGLHGTIPREFIDALQSTEISIESEGGITTTPQRTQRSQRTRTAQRPLRIASVALVLLLLGTAVIILVQRRTPEPEVTDETPAIIAGASNATADRIAGASVESEKASVETEIESLITSYDGRTRWRLDEIKHWATRSGVLLPGLAADHPLRQAHESASGLLQLHEDYTAWSTKFSALIANGIPSREDHEHLNALTEQSRSNPLQRLEDWKVRFQAYSDFVETIEITDHSIDDHRAQWSSLLQNCETQLRTVIAEASILIRDEFFRSMAELSKSTKIEKPTDSTPRSQTKNRRLPNRSNDESQLSRPLNRSPLNQLAGPTSPSDSSDPASDQQGRLASCLNFALALNAITSPDASEEIASFLDADMPAFIENIHDLLNPVSGVATTVPRNVAHYLLTMQHLIDRIRPETREEPGSDEITTTPQSTQKKNRELNTDG